MTKTAILIHPYDLAKLMNDLTINCTTPGPFYNDGLIDVRGQLYLQTTRVPAQTTEIK
jgi:hypothetical protein